MGVSLEIQRMEIFERYGRGQRIDLAVSRVPPKGLGDLDVRQMWHVKPQSGFGDTHRDRASGRRVEQELDQRRRVEDDHHASRSARITSAALRLKWRTGRARSRSSTSWRVGRSSAFPTSRKM
jgi:hypothetical protein